MESRKVSVEVSFTSKEAFMLKEVSHANIVGVLEKVIGLSGSPHGETLDGIDDLKVSIVETVRPPVTMVELDLNVTAIPLEDFGVYTAVAVLCYSDRNAYEVERYISRGTTTPGRFEADLKRHFDHYDGLEWCFVENVTKVSISQFDEVSETVALYDEDIDYVTGQDSELYEILR